MNFSAVMPRQVELARESNEASRWHRLTRAAILLTSVGSLTVSFGLSQNAGSQLTPAGMQLLPLLETVAVDPLLFGESVSVSGDLAVVGAPADSAAATSSGSARVFERLGTNWSEVALLRPPAPEMGEHFGFSVSISSTVVLVGSPESESAYLFTRTGRGWSETAKLTVGDLPQGSRFG